ncbi:MAG: hypothetical protein LBJ67_16300 [Planctomycetaceae bacterium]|nr:hypothetical protein [Planctomycetaceae bacterium]
MTHYQEVLNKLFESAIRYDLCESADKICVFCAHVKIEKDTLTSPKRGLRKEKIKKIRENCKKMITAAEKAIYEEEQRKKRCK